MRVNKGLCLTLPLYAFTMLYDASLTPAVRKMLSYRCLCCYCLFFWLLFYGLNCLASVQQAEAREEIIRAVQAGEATNRDFSGVSAAGLKLMHCNMKNTSWRQADLRGAHFVAVSLENADLREANLRGAILERVNFSQANLAEADCSGALFCLCNFANAQLKNCRLEGATFEGYAYSPTGAAHLLALQMALQMASGQQFSLAWLAGLSGDAFAFAYNTQEPGCWPGVPFSVNPASAAAQNLGLQALFVKETQAEKILLSKPPEQAVYMLALRLPDIDERLLGGQPVWAVLTEREAKQRGALFFRLLAPPFGEQYVSQKELLYKLWSGRWNTLDPVGTALPARRQLIIIPNGAPRPPAEQLSVALRQAAVILMEKRTYGPLIPGSAGWQRLAADLQQAAQSPDSVLAQRLLPWQRLPRHSVIAALKLAAEFLTEAKPLLPPEKLPACGEALQLLSLAQKALDTRWPTLKANTEALTKEQAESFAQAAQIISEIASLESRLATLLAAMAGP